MSRSDSEKCAKLSKLSRTQYVLCFGILGWGVPTAILFALIQGFRFGWDRVLSELIPAIIIFPLAGVFFGLCMWKMLGNRIAKAATTGADK